MYRFKITYIPSNEYYSKEEIIINEFYKNYNIITKKVFITILKYLKKRI
jgi:hypothetical protein